MFLQKSDKYLTIWTNKMKLTQFFCYITAMVIWTLFLFFQKSRIRHTDGDYLEKIKIYHFGN